MSRFSSIIILLLLFSLMQAQDEKSEASNYTSQGMTAYSVGDYPLAIERFKKAFVLRPDYSALAYNISCCYALSGETDSAVAWLEKTFGLGSFLFLEDEDFVSLHGDEKYQELARQAEQRIEALKNQEWLPLVRLPSGYSEDNSYPAVIGLHGFGTSPSDFAKSLESGILEAGYVFCCPYGPHIAGSTAFGWGECEEANERILEAMDYLADNYMIDKTNIILLGFSQGGSMAFCAGLKNPERCAAVVSIAGHYDEELNKHLEHGAVKNMLVYMMIGDNDLHLESNRAAESMMTERGMMVRLIVYPQMGHAFPPNGSEEITKALRWIESHR
jgi:predicted esterase